MWGLKVSKGVFRFTERSINFPEKIVVFDCLAGFEHGVQLVIEEVGCDHEVETFIFGGEGGGSCHKPPGDEELLSDPDQFVFPQFNLEELGLMFVAF